LPHKVCYKTYPSDNRRYADLDPILDIVKDSGNVDLYDKKTDTPLVVFDMDFKNLDKDENVILFHSTNLPNGKGWAPIYHTLIRKKKYFTISGIIANEKVDAGNIIVKARFKIQDNHTAEYLRKWDHEISIMLIREILKKMKGHIKGKKQIAKGDKYPRRYQKDNQIDIKLPFKQTINHIRACEDDHPAFFYINKTKYIIKVEPEKKPNFPKNLEIKFYD